MAEPLKLYVELVLFPRAERRQYTLRARHGQTFGELNALLAAAAGRPLGARFTFFYAGQLRAYACTLAAAGIWQSKTRVVAQDVALEVYVELRGIDAEARKVFSDARAARADTARRADRKWAGDTKRVLRANVGALRRRLSRLTVAETERIPLRAKLERADGFLDAL